MNLAQELLTNIQYKWWFNKFCKGDESLEDKEHSVRPQQVDNNQVRAIIEADPLTSTQGIAKELSVDHSTVIWSKLEKWKSWISGYHMSWQIVLKCYLLLFDTTMNHFMDCDVKWKVDFIWQPAITSSVVGSSSYKSHFPEWNSHRRKRSWSLVVCCLSDLLQLWVLVKPLHLRSMLRKSMRCTKNCNPATGKKAQFSTKSDCSTSEALVYDVQTGLLSFVSSAIFARPLAHSLPFLQASWQLFAGKMLSKSSMNPKVRIFMLRE